MTNTICDWVAALLYAFCAAAVAVRMYMRVPARWLCECDELASEMHMPGMRCARPVKMTVVVGALAAIILLAKGGGAATADVWCELAGDALRGGAAVVAVAFALVATATVVATVLLMVAAMADYEYMIIPDQISVGIFAAGLTINGAVQGFYGAAVAGGLMLFSCLLGSLAGGEGAVGFGDVKLMAACGALVASDAALLYVSSIIGSGAYLAIGVLFRKVRAGDAMPLAPWICAAALLLL